MERTLEERAVNILQLLRRGGRKKTVLYINGLFRCRNEIERYINSRHLVGVYDANVRLEHLIEDMRWTETRAALRIPSLTEHGYQDI